MEHEGFGFPLGQLLYPFLKSLLARLKVRLGVSDARRASVEYSVALLVALACGWWLVWVASGFFGYELGITFDRYNEHLIEGFIFTVAPLLGVRALLIVHRVMGDADG